MIAFTCVQEGGYRDSASNTSSICLSVHSIQSTFSPRLTHVSLDDPTAWTTRNYSWPKDVLPGSPRMYRQLLSHSPVNLIRKLATFLTCRFEWLVSCGAIRSLRMLEHKAAITTRRPGFSGEAVQVVLKGHFPSPLTFFTLLRRT